MIDKNWQRLQNKVLLKVVEQSNNKTWQSLYQRIFLGAGAGGAVPKRGRGRRHSIQVIICLSFVAAFRAIKADDDP